MPINRVLAPLVVRISPMKIDVEKVVDAAARSNTKMPFGDIVDVHEPGAVIVQLQGVAIVCEGATFTRCPTCTERRE